MPSARRGTSTSQLGSRSYVESFPLFPPVRQTLKERSRWTPIGRQSPRSICGSSPLVLCSSPESLFRQVDCSTRQTAFVELLLPLASWRGCGAETGERDVKSIRFGQWPCSSGTASWKTRPHQSSDDLATEEICGRGPEKQINFQCTLRLTYVFALKFYPRWRAAMGLLDRSVAFLDTCKAWQFFRFSRLPP